jgi:uncharacterized protein YlxP (DUF503 family)
MVVGAAEVELHVHASHSLKEKRSAVRSIVRRVRNEFNVAVVEVGGQDTWQWAVLGLAAVGHDGVSVRAILERAVEFIESLHLAEVTDHRIAIVSRGAEPDDEDDEDEEEGGDEEGEDGDGEGDLDEPGEEEA